MKAFPTPFHQVLGIIFFFITIYHIEKFADNNFNNYERSF